MKRKHTFLEEKKKEKRKNRVWMKTNKEIKGKIKLRIIKN